MKTLHRKLSYIRSMSRLSSREDFLNIFGKYILCPFLYLGLIIWLSGCASNGNKSTHVAQRLIAQLSPLELPYKVKLNANKQSNGVMVEPEGEFGELYTHTGTGFNNFLLVGYLPDTSNFYTFFGLGCCSDYDLPYIVTIAKSGKLLGTASPGDTQCGFDCGYKCSDWIYFLENGDIVRKRMTESMECYA